MNRTSGFAYIALLTFLAVLMLMLTSASENISQNAKREREKQLFFVGEQFRSAIARYYETSPQGQKQFPKQLANLLKDMRSTEPQHHLRQLYRDPITDDFTWGLVKNEQQQIVGVYSVSSEPVLTTHFDEQLITADEKQGVLLYSDLKFIYTPEKTK